METLDGQGLTQGEDQMQRTFSVYPQEGASRFPLTEYAAPEKPFSCTVVMSFGCNVMICRWIWGR